MFKNYTFFRKKFEILIILIHNFHMAYEKSNKTKQEIINAFSVVMNKKLSLDKVKVKDIIEEANISKSTFYNHFSDTKSIVNEIFIDLMQVLMKEIDVIFTNKSNDVDENIRAITNKIDEKKRIYQATINSINVPLLMDRFKNYVMSGIYRNIKKHNIELEPKKILQINIIVNGSIDLIIDYLKNRVDYETDVIYSTILDEVKGLNLF